jgi:hypothetical protein
VKYLPNIWSLNPRRIAAAANKTESPIQIESKTFLFKVFGGLFLVSS